MARSPFPSSPSPRGEASRRIAIDDGPAARPPWLEEGDADDAAGSTLIGRRTLWALAIGLIGLIAGVALGVWLLGRQEAQPIDMLPPGAEVPLVRSPGPWKEAPVGPETDGQVVKGAGDLTYPTGDGKDPDGAIAIDLTPEAPLLRPGAVPDAPTDIEEDADTVAIMPAMPPSAPIAPPARSREPAEDQPVPMPIAPPQPVSAGGSTLQLGAFSSETRAREAWKAIAGRFSYLAGLSPVILPTAKDGKTLYRLRVTGAGGPADARDLCGKLRVAGEKCDVVG